MKRHLLGLALLLAPLVAAPAHSQQASDAKASDAKASDAKAYVPDLGDFMGATQLRHFKLWFAGRSQNWDLARYEIEQIRKSYEERRTPIRSSATRTSRA